MNENIDAVKMMREIREKLSLKYWKHADVLKKEMEEKQKEEFLFQIYSHIKRLGKLGLKKTYLLGQLF